MSSIDQSNKKRKILTWGEKKQLCEFRERNPSFTYKELGRKFEVAENTVCNILKDKNKWLSTNPDDANKQKYKAPKYPELERSVEASDKLSAENFIRIEEEIQEFGVENTDEEIISHVKPTAESEPEDELVAVEQKITTEDALKSLDTILSYIQNPPENLTFELKHIKSIKSVKSHISKYSLASKKQSKLDRWFTTKN
nr:3201_t:CDS:2 [Entrophospora candida]